MRKSLGLTIFFILLGGPVSAQFDQYIQPGSMAESPISRKERLEAAMEQARWKLGPVRIAPWFAMKDFSYIDNVYGSMGADKVSDYTATVGAGVHGYLARGKKLVLAFNALPEYVWWKDLAHRRLFNYQTGVGFFGYFNHLTVEANANKSRQQVYVNSEYERPINTARDVAEINTELRLSGRFSLITNATRTAWKYRQADIAGGVPIDLTLLDRDETVARASLRYALSERSTISVGYFGLDTNFRREIGNRSNRGQGLAADLQFVRGAWTTSLTLVAPRIEPKSGSSFVALDRKVLGRFGVSWRLTQQTSVHVYGARNLVYSLFQDSSYSVNEQAGIAFRIKAGWRTTLRLFIEKTWISYARKGPTTIESLSQMYGATGTIALSKSWFFLVRAVNITYPSPMTVSGDKSAFRLQASLQMSGKGGGWW